MSERHSTDRTAAGRTGRIISCARLCVAYNADDATHIDRVQVKDLQDDVSVAARNERFVQNYVRHTCRRPKWKSWWNSFFLFSSSNFNEKKGLNTVYSHVITMLDRLRKKGKRVSRMAQWHHIFMRDIKIVIQRWTNVAVVVVVGRILRFSPWLKRNLVLVRGEHQSGIPQIARVH